MFVLSGGVGVFWTLIWLILVRESPEKDSFINDKELEFIKRQLDQSEHDEDKVKSFISLSLFSYYFQKKK